MLDDQPKSKLDELLGAAEEGWRLALQHALEQRRAPVLGAPAELLGRLSLSGISQSLLPERIGLTKQAVQQSLDQLERLGLIRREVDPTDKRAKLVFLTEAGLYALEARREAVREVEKQFRDLLGKKAFGRLRKGLKKLSAGRGSIRE